MYENQNFIIVNFELNKNSQKKKSNFIFNLNTYLYMCTSILKILLNLIYK